MNPVRKSMTSEHSTTRDISNGMNRRDFLRAVSAGTASLAISGCMDGIKFSAGEKFAKRPNILFCISDDQSWVHAGVYGDKVVKTPNFDRIAAEGVLFTHAFCAAPSCTPSRGAILTGQNIWRLEEGGLLLGTLPAKFQVYTELLEAAGYHVGFTRKGWSPGQVKPSGRTQNPAGRRYKNFKQFIEARPEGQPFCFWFG
ncbi:MAG: sulfatase-like hydrolase/transferase, partial [Planctomycetota bacterium]